MALIAAQPCLAQATPGSDEDEIVVTAERRPEPPQDVPISLTALSGEELENRQATDMASLGKVVPSLTMTRTGAFTQPYLRGVGKRSTLGIENGVATYVDGVYLASSIGALLDLRGIDRIEVLNGPQGTLFGRNTTGGVIQVITRDPGSEFSGEAAVHAGSFGYLRGDLYLTGGDDQIAGNLAVSLSRSGGYGTNLYSGKTDQGDVGHSLVARSKWIWRADGSLKLTLAVDYQDIDQDFSYLPVAGYPPIGQPRVLDFYNRDQDASNRMHFRYGGVSLNADADLGGASLISISAFRRLNARYAAEEDKGPMPLWSAAPIAGQDQFSQEVQLQSAAASTIPWVAGLYYIRIGERYDPTRFSYGGSYSAALGGRIEQTLFDSGRTSSYAAYGQGTLPLDSVTGLTLGLRYTIEQRSLEAAGERVFDKPPFVRPIPGLPILSQAPLRASATFREPTWRAALERHFSDETMGYLSVNRGFQSGGWNLQTPQSPAFAPERLDDFEGGLKYASRSRRFTADASAFYYDYSDLQVSAFTSAGSATTNAASATVYGLELQLAMKVNAGTDFTAGIQWLRSKFGNFPNATCTDFNPGATIPYAPKVCDVTGNRLPYAPELKIDVGGSQRVPLGGAGTLLLSANLAYSSGYFSEADNVVRQKPYVTADASAEWRPDPGALSIRLWVKNLTGTRYYDSLAVLPTAGVLQNPAAPRRVGLSVEFAFQASESKCG